MQILSKKKKSRNALKSGFGRVLGSIGEGLGEDLEGVGSWGLLGCFFVFMFVFGEKSALGGLWLGFWLEFKGFGRVLGKVLAAFWKGLGRIFEHSG